MALRASFLGLVVLALPLALTGCSGSTSCFCGPTQANPLDAESGSIVQDLLIKRMQAGVSKVTICKTLNVSAAAHSDDMRDHDYLSNVSPIDKSDVRARACAAGFKTACPPAMIPMAELVAEGNGTGDNTFAQWATDTKAGPILVEMPFVYVGVGRSIGAMNEYWTLDLSAGPDPSCD